MEMWSALLQTFGLAAGILVFMGWAAVKCAPWLATRVESIVSRVFRSLDSIDAFEGRLMKVEQRIETLWDFQLRRAAVEVKVRGIATVNSPVIISEEAKTWMRGLANELRSFYRKLGRTLTSAQLAEEIERRWGAQIVKEVCIPNGLFQGACLLIAMEVAREGGEEDKSDAPKSSDDDKNM